MNVATAAAIPVGAVPDRGAPASVVGMSSGVVGAT